MSAESLARIYGTEEDRVNCPFFFKIGACRHGDRCSRNHNRPHFSQTLLIPHMYTLPPVNPLTGQPMVNEKEHLTDFCEEVIDELATFGTLEEFHVVANLGEHMLGNVYLKYAHEEEAEKALKALHGRFYAGRQLTCEYSPVTDFRESRCRQYDEETCNRGGFCFPAEDTRLLTDRGFLFLDEVLALRADGAEVQFACFEAESARLLYRSAGLLIKEHSGHLVDITHESEQRRWTRADADDENDASLEKDAARTNRMSLRVTPDHDLYVELGKVGPQGQAEYTPYHKIKADQLYSSDASECVRQLAVAANGVAGDAIGMDREVCAPLALQSPAHLAAFLELYGFWLGAGAVTPAAISFDQVSQGDVAWLRSMLAQAGLTDADWSLDQTHALFVITRPAWVAFFGQARQEESTVSVAHLADSDANAKSVQSSLMWMRRLASSAQLRLVVRGLHRAAGDQPQRLYSTGVAFRDQLLAVLLDAGYSAFFERHHAAAGQQAAAAWRVCWDEPTGTPLAQRLCAPSMSRADVRHVKFEGTVWCVDVEHADHLVVAQRAHRDASGVVTQASRPLIVGNCNFMHMRPLPSVVRKELERVRERGRRRHQKSRSRERGRAGGDRDRERERTSGRDDRSARDHGERSSRDDRRESSRADDRSGRGDVRVPSSSSSRDAPPAAAAAASTGGSSSGRSASEERRAKIAEWNKARDAKKAAEEGGQ